jgi:transcriptional regulator with XRE-family HTH domain
LGQRSANSIDEEIGRRLRARRLELALSQDHVAQAVGVTFQQLQKYEKGVNRVSASTLFALAKTLEISPAQLMPTAPWRERPARSVRSAKVSALVEKYSKLNASEQREALVALIEAATARAAKKE